MTSIQPYLNVPKFIVEGLQNGSMFRTGGVIQESGSGQIIAWLRENGTAVGLPESLLPVNSGLTGAFGNALGIVGGVTLLNLAISGAAVLFLEKRIRDNLAQVVEQEFWRDRNARLDAARQHFINAYRVRSVEDKRHLLRDARSGLTVAEATIVDRIRQLQKKGWLSSGMSDQKAKEAYCFHLMVMNVYKMIALCYLELGELEVASANLEEAVARHERNVHEFVQNCPIPNSISQSLLSGLQNNSRRVRRNDDELSSPRDIDSYLSGDKINKEALSNAFGVLESFDRLRGVSKGLDALGMVYFDWESFAAAQHDGYVTFVDMDQVPRWTKMRGLGRRAKRDKKRR